MEDTTGESGAQAGGSTAPAAPGGDQSSAPPAPDAGTAPDASAATDEVVVPTDEDVDDDAVAEDQLAKADKPDEAADKPNEQATDDEPAKKEPKAIREARAQIDSLESQIKPLREIELRVEQIGGLPVLEMIQPLADVALDPAATGLQIIEKAAEVSGRDASEIAWDVVDANREAVVKQFCGENITPEILEKLVDGFESGAIKLDDEDEADDDVFLTDRQKRDRETARAAEKAQADAQKAEASAKSAELNTQRTETFGRVGKLLEDTVNTVLAPYAIKDGDSEAIKTLKTVLNDSVHSIAMRNLSKNPLWSRVQGLLQSNGFAAGERLAKGSLAMQVQREAESLMEAFNPMVEGVIGQAQAAAKKIKEVRDEPSGATTQGDVVTKDEEITAKDPNWRQKLDAKLERDLAAISAKSKKRDQAGRYSGTGR